MDNSQDQKDTFLADWLDGKMADEQLQQLVSPQDFEAYLKLREAMNAYEFATPDMERNFAAIQAKKATPKIENRVRKIPRYVYFSVAAGLLLCFGLYHFFAFSNVRQTGFGNTTALTLADGSKLTLNAKSKVEYPSLFAYNRNLRLEGEAFFEVGKGSKFTVNTPQGKVEVLGTKFNVVANAGFFEVNCYEGRVKVTHGVQSQILTVGRSVRFYNQKTESWYENTPPKPQWIEGESAFSSTPMQQVILEFKNQYHCEVQYPEHLRGVRFTGSFTHKNKKTALQSICIPMQLQCTQTANGKITIAE